MRTLKFIVDGQILRQDPTCDFNNIVPGTEGYLRAEFAFSQEWDRTVKVVSFTRGNKEFTPQVLKDNKSCTIPSEALEWRIFQLKVIGRRSDFKIITNKIAVLQDGGQT